MESYIEDKKNLYTSIHEFLEGSDEHNDDEINNESFQKLINVIRTQQIEGNREEMLQFLEIIKSIGENHHRDQQFNERMNQLLIQYKEQIKQTLSNSEIFHIFERNKKVVLFLIQEGILEMTEEVCKEMMSKNEYNGKRYCHFFIPELEKHFGEEQIAFVKNELLNKDPSIFTDYEEKRKEGENDSYICSLIRQDLIEEFITYLNRHNISPTSQISASIFETNPFLVENKNTTLIEYSAFFGSIQIFQYLLMNSNEIPSSVWLYTIHSKNAEVINLLETKKIPPPESKTANYEQCLIESIKCHHNDIVEYIENNLIDQEEKDSYEIMSQVIKYHNYAHFKVDQIIDKGFINLCFYNYDKLVKLLLEKKDMEIRMKIIPIT